MSEDVTTIRVLHAVEPYLNISENWIYPQITQVPLTEPFVLCTTLINAESFPIEPERLLVQGRTPPRSLLKRAVRSAAYRSGYSDLRTRLRLRRKRVQLIHAHFGMQGCDCVRLKQKLQVPLVTAFYGVDAWRLPKHQPTWRSRYEELFAAGDAFLAEGRAMRDRLIEIGCPEPKIRVQHIGVDLTKLTHMQKDFSGTLAIVLVGRFVEKKGLADGLRACASAADRGADLRVTIIGDAPQEDIAGQQIKAELHALADASALKGRVRFAGFCSVAETRALVAKHNVLLAPSRHAEDGDAEGGLPVILLEAMAQGLLCIGARHCDIPEALIDGTTGFLCPERDYETMADALTRMRYNGSRLRQITAQGRKHIEENFSLEKQLRALRSLYSELTAVPARNRAPGFGAV